MTTKIPPYIYMEILNYKEKSFLGSIPQSDKSFVLFGPRRTPSAG